MHAVPGRFHVRGQQRVQPRYQFSVIAPIDNGVSLKLIHKRFRDDVIRTCYQYDGYITGIVLNAVNEIGESSFIEFDRSIGINPFSTHTLNARRIEKNVRKWIAYRGYGLGHDDGARHMITIASGI